METGQTEEETRLRGSRVHLFNHSTSPFPSSLPPSHGPDPDPDPGPSPGPDQDPDPGPDPGPDLGPDLDPGGASLCSGVVENSLTQARGARSGAEAAVLQVQ